MLNLCLCACFKSCRRLTRSWSSPGTRRAPRVTRNASPNQCLVLIEVGPVMKRRPHTRTFPGRNFTFSCFAPHLASSDDQAQDEFFYHKPKGCHAKVKMRCVVIECIDPFLCGLKRRCCFFVQGHNVSRHKYWRCTAQNAAESQLLQQGWFLQLTSCGGRGGLGQPRRKWKGFLFVGSFQKNSSVYFSSQITCTLWNLILPLSRGQEATGEAW